LAAAGYEEEEDGAYEYNGNGEYYVPEGQEGGGEEEPEARAMAWLCADDE
jgi:hypothetical protein